MLSIHANRPQPPHVTALFRDGAHSFLLSQGATLAELAGRIDVLGARHEGALIAIHVQLGHKASEKAGQLKDQAMKKVEDMKKEEPKEQ